MSVDTVLKFIKRFIPRSLFGMAQPYYHGALAMFGAILYRFPAKRMTVIGVTGTKGKSSTCEYLNAIFEQAGYKTVLISTIRIKVADESKAESRHMTMPGRTTIQRTLAQGLKKGCTVAILEISSEGAKQWRDRFLYLDSLIFTNLTPEHIESHGSFEKYAAVKLGIAERLAHSPKRPRTIIANTDDPRGKKFLETPVEKKLPYSLGLAEPYTTTAYNSTFTFHGESIRINFPGEFSIMNALAACTLAEHTGIDVATMREAFSKLTTIPGRAENVTADRNFAVVIDYAHTPESLEAIYKAYDGKRRICVLGGTGGGRDKWKRPKMGAVADKYCAHIILTNEDPYDEDPQAIIDDVASGISQKAEVIIDRRAAIRRAIEIAAPGDAVLVTGKGSNPSICGPKGNHIPWSDARVAREELADLGK